MTSTGPANTKPRHADLDQFTVSDHCLQVAGRSLTSLAEQMGSEPFYVYDRQVMEKQVAALRELLPETLHLHYAIKANPMPQVVATLAELTDGLDVADRKSVV